MRFHQVIFFSILSALISVTGIFAKESGKEELGEKLFYKHCIMCHPDGENIINPQKTLHVKDLRANGISKKEDIVYIIRNPGPGMPKYDKEKISDELAEEIAEYILETFK
ncbi:MAG: c-type cytochrome [Nitrospirota bacterium]